MNCTDNIYYWTTAAKVFSELYAFIKVDEKEVECNNHKKEYKEDKKYDNNLSAFNDYIAVEKLNKFYNRGNITWIFDIIRTYDKK